MLVRQLFDDEFWLVGREDDPALKAKRATVTAPVAEKLVLLEEGHCLREHTLAACARSESSNTSGVEATSLLTLVQMVESGIGLALVPEIALNSGLLSGTRLVARPLTPPVPKRTIALLARALEREAGGLDGAGRFHRGRAQARPLRRHQFQGAAAPGLNGKACGLPQRCRA